jgi:hypothetical protein
MRDWFSQNSHLLQKMNKNNNIPTESSRNKPIPLSVARSQAIKLRGLTLELKHRIIFIDKT